MIRPNLQKDDDGNFIYYPCIFFSKHGYLMPDEETADKLDDSFIIMAAFQLLWLAMLISIKLLIAASILYCIVVFVLRYRGIRGFPRSDRKYSWEYFANAVGAGRSKLTLYLISLGMLCCAGFGVSSMLLIPSIMGVLVGLLLSIFFLFGFCVFTLAIYFRKKESRRKAI